MLSYPLLIAIAALSWYRLDLAVLLVPLFAPFFLEPKHLAIGPHSEKEFPPSEIFLVIDVVLGLAAVVAGRVTWSWGSIRRVPFVLPGLLLLLAGTASTLAAVDRHHALEWYRWTILEPIAFFALLLVLDRSPGWWRLLLASVVAAGMLAGLLAMMHVDAPIAAPPPGAEQQLPRIRGPYGSADNLGLLLDRSIPIWLALALLGSKRWWLAGLILGPTLLLTFSRGAWAATLVGCLLVLVLALRWGRWIATGFLAVAILSGALGGSVLVHALQTGHAHTVERRLDLWESSLAMIRDHPLLGIGPDNFITYFAPTRRQNRWQSFCPPGKGYIQPGAGAEPCLSHPHNVLLDFWLSTGILGLAAFIWLQIAFWRRSLRLVVGPRRLVRALGIGAMGAMLASLTHGLVDESYFLPDLAVIFWLICACIALLPQTEEAERQRGAAPGLSPHSVGVPTDRTRLP